MIIFSLIPINEELLLCNSIYQPVILHIPWYASFILSLSLVYADAVELLGFTEVDGCECTRIFNICLSGIATWQLVYIPPFSASAAEESTFLSSLDSTYMAVFHFVFGLVLSLWYL